MADYVTGNAGDALRVGILPSAFNPPTIAHFALADAAQQSANLDEVVFALPRELPHKAFDGASPEQRIAMLKAALAGRAARGIVLTDGGLFIEMARELKALHPPEAEVFLICGKDAAQRIASWDYSNGPSFEDQLQEFTLLVGDRDGRYAPDTRWGQRVQAVSLPDEFDVVSSANLRQRRRLGEGWKSLTTPAVAELIERWGLYL